MDTEHRIATLRRELRDAVGDRALALYYIFRELRGVIGEDEAKTLMRRALYEQGQAAGGKMAAHARAAVPGPMTPTLFTQMSSKLVPDEGTLYPIQPLCMSDGHCDLQVTSCPVKDRLVEWKLPPEDFETVTYIADGWSYGAIEALGLGYWSETPKWGAEGCCRMHVTTRDDPTLAEHAAAHPLAAERV